MNCSDDKFQYKAMKFLLENGDSLFITDSITQNYNIVSDSITQQKILEQIKSGKPVLLDSSQLNNINKKKSMHLNNYAPYLRTLSGDKIDIKTLYKEYIILVEFIMSGRPNLTAIKIRRVMKDVEKLNKQFNNRMQIVLINGDLINNNMQANM